MELVHTVAQTKPKKGTKTMTTDYPFIRAYGRIMGSYQYYIDDEVRRAREDGAPQDAWSFCLPDCPSGPRKWRLARNLRDTGPHSLRAKFDARGLYNAT